MVRKKRILKKIKLDLDKHFKFTLNIMSRLRTFYLLREDLERLKKVIAPIDSEEFLSVSSQFDYHVLYRGTISKIGTASSSYLLPSEEIMEYLLQDSEFIEKCIESGKTDFLPEDVVDIFIF